MDLAQTWQLLERGGVSPRAGGPARREPGTDEPATETGAQDAWQPAKYNGLADPVGADTLGRTLAERARHLGVDTVLIWEEPQDIVLGQVVGRELGVPIVRSFNMDGLVGHSAPLARGDRVLLLADAFRDPATVRAMAALVEQQGAAVVGTAVLVETDALAASGGGTGQVVALVSARGDGAR